MHRPAGLQRHLRRAADPRRRRLALFVTDFESDASLAGARGQVRAKTGTFLTPNGDQLLLKGQALGGFVETRSGRELNFQLVVNDVAVEQVQEVLAVFQDQGTISAILWRDF